VKEAAAKDKVAKAAAAKDKAVKERAIKDWLGCKDQGREGSGCKEQGGKGKGCQGQGGKEQGCNGVFTRGLRAAKDKAMAEAAAKDKAADIELDACLRRLQRNTLRVWAAEGFAATNSAVRARRSVGSIGHG
jgi:hypothetical protein